VADTAKTNYWPLATAVAWNFAAKNGVKTIAFPAISTGAYGFPVQRAAKIAISEIKAFLLENDAIEKAISVCFDPQTLKAYQSEMR
jgi:O-acetyl-ADP-ribose deacetylase